VISGDDCLNLNVWTPDPGGQLPVLVWIHGGSFMNGSGSVGAHDGTAFARDGVVCVTINYRLAAEGFLFLDDGTANLGLLDQLAALRWVRENIAAFGGDPARVTVAGESAGSMSVTTLLSMPLSEGLFARAIAQSGAGAHTLTAQQGRTVAGYLAKALGVPADRESIKAVPLDQLVRAASDLVVEVQTNPDPDRVHRIWVDFITRGEPGWAPYDPASRTTGLLTEDVSVVDDPAGDERAVWEGVR
jgi:para-nitrobenzyl esterase